MLAVCFGSKRALPACIFTKVAARMFGWYVVWQVQGVRQLALVCTSAPGCAFFCPRWALGLAMAAAAQAEEACGGVVLTHECATWAGIVRPAVSRTCKPVSKLLSVCLCYMAP